MNDAGDLFTAQVDPEFAEVSVTPAPSQDEAEAAAVTDTAYQRKAAMLFN